jgi:putative sigma-54 modulation protein
MNMNASALDFSLTPAIERHIENRVALALQHAARSINSVAVRLHDINGTRGGVDKSCRIVALLRDRATVVVEAVDRDLYAAVDAAATKLKEAVRRRTRRRRTLRREHVLRRPFAAPLPN